MQNFLKYINRFAFRDNRLIEKASKEFDVSPRLSSDEQATLQVKLLNLSLARAVEKIPFYRMSNSLKKMEKDGINNLKKFPVISKADLLSKQQEFYPNSGKKKAWWPLGKTSGTTGSPLEIYRSYNSILYENAFLRRHWSWSGFKRGMRRATLRGDMVVPIEKRKPPYWYQNLLDNQLLISSRHLQKDKLPSILEKLIDFSPYILEAYPSTAYAVAKFLESENSYVYIPYVYTGSEMLYEHQRELIEQRFKSKVMDFYGMAERVAFASECEHGNLHLNTDYSFVEILDEDNNPTKNYGYVVGTSFHNLLMPLVRYKLSDITKWKIGSCPCGRTFPMIEPIQGKFEDILYGGKGDSISPSVLTFAFKGVKNINKSQVAQVNSSSWEIRIVPESGLGEIEEKLLFHNIKTMVDPSVNVSIQTVSDIPRTQSGKYRWVINEWISEKREPPQ